jgi:acyl-CoA thioesterase
MELAQDLFEQDQMMQLLEAEIQSVSNGCVVLEMRVTQKMVQKHGTCQGGALFALADAAFGISANCNGREAVSQHCSITYLRPAHLGETVIARPSKRSQSGRTSIYDVVLLTSEDKILAEFRGVARER